MRVLIVGMGNIGRTLLEIGEFEKVYFYDTADINVRGAIKLAEFFVPEDVDTVVECASSEAVKKFSFDILEAGKDFLVLSTSAFADRSFREAFFERLQRSTSRLIIPSGAVGGLDVVVALGKDMVEKVLLETRKPSVSLGMEASEQRVVFEGNAENAALLFPKNMNVAATLGLVVGFEKVHVRLVADPWLSYNVHILTVESKIGKYRFEMENFPSPSNPKTSAITVYSALKSLKDRCGESKILIG